MPFHMHPHFRQFLDNYQFTAANNGASTYCFERQMPRPQGTPSPWDLTKIQITVTYSASGLPTRLYFHGTPISGPCNSGFKLVGWNKIVAEFPQALAFFPHYFRMLNAPATAYPKVKTI